MREQPGEAAGFHPLVEARVDWQIETFVPSETHADLNKFYRAKLAEQRKKYQEFLDPNGDFDSIGEEEAEAEWEAAEQMSETVPTTVAGMLALIAYVDELANGDFYLSHDEKYVAAILQSLAKAARALQVAA